TEWDDRLGHARPEQVRHQTLEAARDFFVALAQKRPLGLVLEDLHWADALSLDLISLLLESLPQAPLAMLCVYRPEREHRCRHLPALAGRKCAEQLTEMHLRQLSPAHSRRLVAELLDTDDLAPIVERLILEKARGNPLFVEEVVRAFVDA